MGTPAQVFRRDRPATKTNEVLSGYPAQLWRVGNQEEYKMESLKKHTRMPVLSSTAEPKRTVPEMLNHVESQPRDHPRDPRSWIAGGHKQGASGQAEGSFHANDLLRHYDFAMPLLVLYEPAA